MGADWSDFVSLDFQDPESARAWMDDTNLTPDQRRRVKAWVNEWETDNGQEFVSGLDRHSDAISKEYASLIEAMEADCREAAEVPLLLKRGRITTAGATKRLAQLVRNRESHTKRLAAISGSAERWEQVSDSTPTERLRVDQERFHDGMPKHGVRSLTAAILRGDPR